VTEGGRFILREGHNIPPGAPLENLWAMYETLKEHGRCAGGEVGNSKVLNWQA